MDAISIADFKKMMNQKPTKYNNEKPKVDGIKFDSQREANRYCELKMLQKLGQIKNLELQKKFVLIPSQKIDGKCVERECSYLADFVYLDKDNKLVVEDSKGFRTKDYVIKRKLMLYVHGIRIKEV